MRSFLILICLSLYSCSEPEQVPFAIPLDATSLLTGDSTKAWKIAKRFNGAHRMNMGACFLSHRQLYSIDETMRDNSGQNPNCGPTLNASWKFVLADNGHSYLKLSSPQLPILMNIEETYKFFKILELSETSLILQYQHQQFNKKRTITDHYVPEHIKVPDRDFHL